MAISKHTAVGAVTRLSPHVAGIKDFDPTKVQNSVLLTDGAHTALGDLVPTFRDHGLITGEGAETRLNLSSLRQIAEAPEQAAEVVGGVDTARTGVGGKGFGG